MTKRNQLSLHIMGIGGSAMSAIAILAHHMGFEVTGCDLAESTPYIDKVKKLGIKTYVGHDEKHIVDADVVAVTPAAFFQSENHHEFESAKKKKILLTGRQFEAKYLHKDKELICIAGTHGKSTTTALASLVFENGGLDPWVMLGATIREWQSNCRVGNSNLFIVESDEFFDNFLSYQPETIILNNIEFDHPDYFKNEQELYASFKKHVESLKGKKNLIINQDSLGIKKLLSQLDKETLRHINIYGYTTKEKPTIKVTNSTRAVSINLAADKTEFKAINQALNLSEKFSLQNPGMYSISNALGVIILAKLYKIPQAKLSKSIKNFSGIGRRLEFLGEKNGIKVFDDYAHHPTAVKVTLAALRQKFPNNKIWAVIEPHMFSRTKILLNHYKDAFDSADEVIIAPIFKSRDVENFGVNGQSIVDMVSQKSIKYIDSFDEITKHLLDELRPGDVVIVMGAGNSYKLSRDILDKL